ncbi:MAG: hypothetical protein C5B50_12935 [Verrucomicrobia bacterium]|nr:MAG: hypothetical protein C5B50_12935 [Verrucomicrobiota bacterium]
MKLQARNQTLWSQGRILILPPWLAEAAVGTERGINAALLHGGSIKMHLGVNTPRREPIGK